MIGGLTNGTAELTDKIEIETSAGLSKYLTIAQIQALLGANSWKFLPIGFEYVQRSGFSLYGSITSGSTTFTLTADSSELSVTDPTKINISGTEYSVTALLSGTLGIAGSTYTLSAAPTTTFSGHIMARGSTGLLPGARYGGGTWVNVSATWGGRFDRIEGGASPNTAAAFGATQDDRMQGHYHKRNIDGTAEAIQTAVAGAVGTVTTGASWIHSYTNTAEAVTDGTNGNPVRVGTETRSANSTVRIWRLTAY